MGACQQIHEGGDLLSLTAMLSFSS